MMNSIKDSNIMETTLTLSNFLQTQIKHIQLNHLFNFIVKSSPNCLACFTSTCITLDGQPHRLIHVTKLAKTMYGFFENICK